MHINLKKIKALLFVKYELFQLVNVLNTNIERQKIAKH